MARRVLGVLAGNDLSPARLRVWADSAELVAAADGGADRLLAAGVAPHLVVGDLDSATPAALAAAGRVVRVASQDDTDCDKLLAVLHGEGVRDVTLANLEGDQLDHVLGSLGSCLRSPVRVRLLLRRGLAWVLGPGPFAAAAPPGARVSLLPLVDCDGVDLAGVAWPIEGGQLSLGGRSSVSNRAVAPRVSGRIGAGGALLFVGHDDEAPPDWPQATVPPAP